jgi:hypothetical protein
LFWDSKSKRKAFSREIITLQVLFSPDSFLGIGVNMAKLSLGENIEFVQPGAINSDVLKKLPLFPLE